MNALIYFKIVHELQLETTLKNYPSQKISKYMTVFDNSSLIIIIIVFAVVCITAVIISIYP